METIGIGKEQIVEVASKGRQFKVGTLASFEDRILGTQVFLHFQSAAAIANRGQMVITLAGTAGLLLNDTNAGAGFGQGHQVGAAMAAMAVGDFGWMQVYGRGPIMTLADTSPGTFLNTTLTGGTVNDDSTAGAVIIRGISLDSISGAAPGVNEAGHFNWPIAGELIAA